MTVSKEKAALAKQKAKEKAAALKGKSTAHVGGFMNFVREQGVVGLAVGLAIGGAATILIKSLLDNIIMPPIGLLLGSAEGLRGLSLVIGHDTVNDKTVDVVVRYGTFLNDFINFLIIAFVVYIVVHILGLDKKLDKKKE